MFNKKAKPYTELLGKTNRIVEGTIIKGDIISKADFRLDGVLIGNFETTGKLVVGLAGSITGDIICNNADIEGKFNGNIQVAEVLNVKSKASIHGDVTVGKLSVEPGADFSASCVMKINVKNLYITDEQEIKKQQTS
ncbi:MAG: cytoskeletal protein CcmA (bactofilin family) [Flavobacterium sp.]|jgi:cytoskeletal protein CcmA (bactofilin family)